MGGRTNLKKLKSLIKNVKPNHQSWKIGLKWNIMTGGFLETLLNFRHIIEDLIKTKKEVDKFNEARTNLKIYKTTIDQLLELKQSLNPIQNKMQKQKIRTEMRQTRINKLGNIMINIQGNRAE